MENDTNELQELIDTYINGNLSVIREAINKRPWLQTDIYIALPSDYKDLFINRCRAWHSEAFQYSNIK